MSRPPRIWISSETPAKGEIVRLRVQIAHPMETGFRSDANGQPIPRNTLTRFQALFDGAPLMEFLPETAISQNPYIEFTFLARQSGVLKMIWTDARGDFAEAEKTITVA